MIPFKPNWNPSLNWKVGCVSGRAIFSGIWLRGILALTFSPTPSQAIPPDPLTFLSPGKMVKPIGLAPRQILAAPDHSYFLGSPWAYLPAGYSGLTWWGPPSVHAARTNSGTNGLKTLPLLPTVHARGTNSETTRSPPIWRFSLCESRVVLTRHRHDGGGLSALALGAPWAPVAPAGWPLGALEGIGLGPIFMGGHGYAGGAGVGQWGRGSAWRPSLRRVATRGPLSPPSSPGRDPPQDPLTPPY